MRKCIKCGKEKELEKFRKCKRWFSHTCKECYAAKYRTGKPNLGKFKKGIIPKTAWKKGNPSWNKGAKYQFIPGKHSQKGKPLNEKTKAGYKKYAEDLYEKSICRYSKRSLDWSKKIKDRDGQKCMKCGSKRRIVAHHIIPWRIREDLRYEIDNGITLCQSCHAKLEGFQVGHKRIER